MCLIILALIIGAIILAKKGKLGPPPWLRNGGEGWGPGGPGGPCGPGHHGPGHHGPGHHQHGPAPEDHAYGILAERLASGDIDPDEYRERVAVLRETSATQYGPTSPGPQAEPNPNDPNPGDLR